MKSYSRPYVEEYSHVGSFDVLSCCCSQIHLTVPLGEYQSVNCERH